MTTSRTFRGSFIENEAAYQAAIHRNIIANAKKTWRKNNPDDCDAIEDFISAGRHESRSSRTGYTYDNNFVGSLAKAFDTYGKLSDKQCAAVVKIINDREQKRADRIAAIEAQKARSAYLGVASEKLSTRAVVEAVIKVQATKFNYYDSDCAYIYLMRDEAGNRISYKTKSFLAYTFKYSKKCVERFENITRGENYSIIHDDAMVFIKAGMTIDFTATIKMHTEYKGEKQTVVQRLKVSSVEWVEGGIKDVIDKTE
jgi:hypothetical protein